MPERHPIRLYTRESDKPAVPWEVVDERLRSSIVYWLVSGSAARPVWGVWHEEGLWLSVGSPTLLGSLDGADRASAHLEDGHDVVILEGTPSIETDEARLQPFCDVYNAKYTWDFTVATIPGPVVVLTPRTVFAWKTGSYLDAKSDPFPLAASRFVF